MANLQGKYKYPRNMMDQLWTREDNKEIKIKEGNKVNRIGNNNPVNLGIKTHNQIKEDKDSLSEEVEELKIGINNIKID